MRYVIFFLFAAPFFAQSVVVPQDSIGFEADWLKTKYFRNLDAGSGAYVNITNTGRSGGKICVNVYAFNPSEEMFFCESCAVGPNGLKSYNVFSDIVGSAFTPAAPTAAVIKLLATKPVNGACNAGQPFTAADLALGMVAWGTSVAKTAAEMSATETTFSRADLDSAELNKLTLYCGVMRSWYGLISTCQARGL
jgi:hypothetical protein